ncbi:MAG: YaaR family protein [Spirochaetaceae bacterium]|jgi:uncharacterized protein YaaR (DUF327 family)|nr:YaaR family protein [Spirochaetaceae bacterium]
MSRIDIASAQLVNPFLTNSLSPVKNKEANKTAARGKSSFFTLLKKNDESEAAAAIEEDISLKNADVNALLDDVHNAGDMLKNRPFAEEIKQYKSAIRRFISFVVENAFSLEESEGIQNKYKAQFKNKKGGARDARKPYTMIAVIDQKLENLAAQIMASQGEKFHLLARIEEINGLLVNLLLK